MKVALQFAAVFALLCLGVSTAILAIDAHHFALAAQQTLKDIDDEAKVQGASLAANEQHLDLVLDQLNSAAAEQRTYWQKTSADSDKTVKALRIAVDRASLLLDHTDKQLNGVILPDADRQFNLTAQAAQTAFASLGHASDALTFQIDDMQPIFAELRVAAEHAASGMGHGDKILADGEKTADYYAKKLMTPASFAEKLGEAFLKYGSELGNIVTGFVK